MTPAEYAKAVVAQAPPLSSEQRARLAELMRPIRRPDAKRAAA